MASPREREPVTGEPAAHGPARPEPPTGEGFPKARRIRRRGDYKAVQSRGRRVVTPSFVLLVRPNAGLGRRLGITVTRKTLPRSVDRNRVKRVLREVFRRNRTIFPNDADVVVVARRRALDAGYQAARAELEAVRDPLARAARAGRASDGGPRDEPAGTARRPSPEARGGGGGAR